MNPVQVAAKLYDARDSVRNLFGEKYPEKIAPFQELTKKAAAKTGHDEMRATMELVKMLQNEDPVNSGMRQIMVLAAYVELIEPSF